MTTCVSLIKACRVRLVRLDECGVPVVGNKSVISASGFVSVSASADIETGEEFLQKNACGELCINEKDCDVLKRYNLTIQWCLFDPDAVEIVTGQRLLLDAAGDAKGIAVGEALQCDGGYSLEMWQKVAGQAACDPGNTTPNWMWWAWPYVTGGQMGDLTFENGAFLFETTGYTKPILRDNQFGPDNRGPLVGGAQPLPASAPLMNGEHMGNYLTDLAPPEVSCGATEYAAA